jgi:hypothetical protein
MCRQPNGLGATPTLDRSAVRCARVTTLGKEYFERPPIGSEMALELGVCGDERLM